MQFDLSQYFPIIQTILLLVLMEGLLSVDNAAVIGAMASKLPDVAIPQTQFALLNRLLRKLGNQPDGAKNVGIFMAYIGRIIMLFVAAILIQNIWVRIFGAAYLIKLGLKHLSVADQPGETQIIETQKQHSFWMTVLMITIADMSFALDNVVTAVGISDALPVVILGVGLGIITMAFAAGIAMRIMKKEPRYAYVAYLLILEIGVGLLLETYEIVHITEVYKATLSVTTIAVTVAYIKLPIIAMLFNGLVESIGEIIGNLNELIDSITRMFLRFLRFVVRIFFSTWSALKPKPHIAIE
jgi:tellurite resistance protein TerC